MSTFRAKYGVRPRRIRNLLLALIACGFAVTSSALVSTSEKGLWPEDWPQELEPFRQQAITLDIGTGIQQRIFEIRFESQEQFEQAWPAILKLRTTNSPVTLYWTNTAPPRAWGSLLNNESPAIRIYAPSLGYTTGRDAPRAETREALERLVAEGRALRSGPPWPRNLFGTDGTLPEYVEQQEVNGRLRWVPSDFGTEKPVDNNRRRGFVHRARVDVDIVADGQVIDLSKVRLPRGTTVNWDELPVPELTAEQRWALVKQAQETFSRHVRTDPRKRSHEIPRNLWGPEIADLNPIRVVDHFVNIKVVLAAAHGVEAGYYINLPISSFGAGEDYFLEFVPLAGGDEPMFGSISRYKRIRPAKEWEAARLEARNRERPLIFNNDGNEPVYFCKEASAQELLRSRTTPLADSKVSTIFYCTWSSGFGLFTHHTKVGQLFDTREAMFKDNRTREFFEKGIDPLKVMAEFARSNRMEIFWSMRMNDTHDGSSAAYGPVMFRANRLKNEHPEWLIGTREKRPKYGAWSAVDYAVPEIRDLAFSYCEEVCRNYDVDGIELDFFRHAFFFRCSGRNEACGPEELDQMTGLLCRIRAATDEIGRNRDKPILLAARVPDSIEYCRFIGLDIERWLEEELIDLMVVSGYTQLNPWDYSVQLGARHGVKVYPSLDEPRLQDKEANALRQSLQAYRGRALTAWNSGVDGIYMFNFFDPTSPLWRELHSPAALRKLDRRFFTSVRGAGSMPVPHQQYIRIPTLNPARPISMPPGKSATVSFQTGERSDVPGQGTSVLWLRFKAGDPVTQCQVSLNDVALSGAQEDSGWVKFPLKPGSLNGGKNVVRIQAPEAPAPLTLLDCYAEVAKAPSNRQ